jgi:hypothetical protein
VALEERREKGKREQTDMWVLIDDIGREKRERKNRRDIQVGLVC